MKKKGIFCLLIAAALCGTLTASAQNIEEDISDISVIPISEIADLNIDSSCFDYEVVNHDISTINAIASSKTLDVTHYFQDGETWSDDKLGTSSYDTNDTIGSHGCLVASVAMVQKFNGGVLNPRGVNNVLKRAGLNTDDLSLDGVATAFNWNTELKVYKTKTADDTAISYIKDEIDADRPVIVGLAKFNSTTVTNTHFVVAYGYSGDTIYINDPLSTNDYDTLNDYLVKWWVYNLRSYSK